MEIIEFDEKYRDDMIFMVLEAKDALGRIPTINADLLDVKTHYIDKGDMFWLGTIDGRVVACVGYNSIENTNDVILHRLYIKASLKRKGLGSLILSHAENYLKQIGKENILIHLGDKQYYFESYNFYQKHDYTFVDDRHMKKSLV